MSVFALIDGNNFYVSCERVFNPKLEGRPVVDGSYQRRLGTWHATLGGGRH